MNNSSRPIYRAFAWSFLGIGGAFLLIAVLEVVLNFSFFKGNPFPVALFLTLIGAALLYTANELSAEGAEDDEHSADDSQDSADE